MKKIISILILCIFTLMGCTSQPYSTEKQSAYFQIGNYINQDIDSISKETYESINVVIKKMYSESIKTGYVVYQYPYPEKIVSKGDDLTLYISQGPAPQELNLTYFPMEEARKSLEEGGYDYREVEAYNVAVEKGVVFGTYNGENGVTCFVSKGRPKLQHSAKCGYAAEAGEHIFYTDNAYIYRLNEDGSSSWLTNARDLQGLFIYDDWLVHKNEEFKEIYAYNYSSEETKLIDTMVGEIYGIVDGQIIYKGASENAEKNALLSASLYTDKIDVLYEGDVREVIINDDQVFLRAQYPEDETILSDIICCDLVTKESKMALFKEEIDAIFVWNNQIVYMKNDTLINLENFQKFSIPDINPVFINDDCIFYFSYDTNKREMHLYNLISNEDIFVCESPNYLGFDEYGRWYYYHDKGSTYRIKSDGSTRELVSNQVLSKGYYDSLIFIDDWIYYFDDMKILSRFNISSKEVEIIAENPTDMPWWSKI